MKPEALRTLVAQNKIEEALQAMLQVFRDGELNNFLFMESSMWHELERKRLSGTLYPHEEYIESNKVKMALLGLIDMYEKAGKRLERAKETEEGVLIHDEIQVPDQVLTNARKEEVTDRHRKPFSFILHLVTSERYIRITAPSGIPAGKLADYIAHELFPVIRNQDFTWRFEKASGEIPSHFELGMAGIEKNGIVYLTAEYMHKGFIPELIMPGQAKPVSTGVVIGLDGKLHAAKPECRILVDVKEEKVKKGFDAKIAKGRGGREM